jgi:hypothetical protein
LHIGSASCDEAAIRNTVRAIVADERAFWFSLGDLAEYIPRSDFRFRQSRLAPWLRGLETDYCDDLVAKQIERLCEILAPIAPRCLGAVYGNHEDRLLARFERDVHREVCRRLQIADLSDEAIARLIFTRGRTANSTQLDIYLHHGWFASRKAGAKVNNLHDLFLTLDVDIAAVGHGHERIVAPPLVTLRLNKEGELTYRRRIALMTGCFFRTHAEHVTSYASARGYRAGDVGGVVVRICPSTREMTAEI